jgi:hypothetical protein
MGNAQWPKKFPEPGISRFFWAMNSTSNFFCGPLDIKRNILGSLSWLQWKFSQHLHYLSLKMEMIVTILRWKSLICFYINKNNGIYVQPVWLVSFSVEDTPILKMEVDQVKIFLTTSLGNSVLYYYQNIVTNPQNTKTGKDKWDSQDRWES